MIPQPHDLWPLCESSYFTPNNNSMSWGPLTVKWLCHFQLPGAKCNGKLTSFKTVIHRVMCVNLKPIVHRWGLSVVGVLTLSCPAVSQIRNLCSSFPHGTVLVRNDALQTIRSVSQQCFWACSLKGTGNKAVQVSRKQMTLRINMLDYEPMLHESTNAVLGQSCRKLPNKKEPTQFV